MFSVRTPANTKLLLIKFGGSQKLYVDCWLCRESVPQPLIVQGWAVVAAALASCTPLSPAFTAVAAHGTYHPFHQVRCRCKTPLNLCSQQPSTCKPTLPTRWNGFAILFICPCLEKGTLLNIYPQFIRKKKSLSVPIGSSRALVPHSIFMLVSMSGYNKVPKTEWLKIIQMYCLSSGG